jgi:hypothetical protein
LLWESLLELSREAGEEPTTEYADRVYRAYAIEGDLRDGYIALSEITAEEREDVHLIETERKKFEAMKAWETAQEAAAAQARSRSRSR